MSLRYLLLLLIAGLLAVPSAASAATKNGVTPVSPKAGKSIPVGERPTMKVRARGGGQVWIHVCKSKKKNADGLICTKESIGRAKKKGGTFQYKPKFFDFPEFCFAVKSSRYLTHMKRLTDMDRGVGRFYDSIAPLAESPKLGPVLWQLADRFARDDDRLAFALENLPPGRHAFELRHPSWFAEPVYELLRAHGAAFVIHDDLRRRETPEVLTADFTYLRFHHGRRGRRGNYSETELREIAARLRALAPGGEELFVYFNNDWEAFAVKNALRLKRLLET